MKLRVTMKTPDAIDDTIAEADIPEAQRAKVAKKLEKWIKYGEYLTVEFDLDADTATVVE